MMKYFKSIIYSIVISALFLTTSSSLIAGEGMWLPFLLKNLNEKEMQAMGMEMTADDIYSINNGSLKDAIVHFGGFCTAEVISNQGLILTNHHCGYRAIQSHSTVDNNLLESGFWADDHSAELKNDGLTATFIVRIEDVTDEILGNITLDLPPRDRQSKIDRNINKYINSLDLPEYHEASVKAFYEGNEYYMIVTKTYKDVRLVGAPPSSIGKFGADTDNWEWPRHTGDFSLFRIYAGPDNEPAEYSEENKPLQPQHYLPISLDGVEKNDFTLVFGFPGSTDEYMPSYGLNQLVETINPARIAFREVSLDLMDKAMKEDSEIKIQYASKFASIANYYKKWKGENLGLTRTNAIEKKRDFEDEFLDRIRSQPEQEQKYGNLLSQFERLYAERKQYVVYESLLGELTSRHVDLFRISSLMNRLVTIYENNGKEAFNDRYPAFKDYMDGIYENYSQELDYELAINLLEYFTSEIDSSLLSDKLPQTRNEIEERMITLYNLSTFKNHDSFKSLEGLSAVEKVQKIKNDPAVRYVTELQTAFENNTKELNIIREKLSTLQRKYMKALRIVFPDRTFYPNANSTMRVTYGQVDGYEPKDGVEYEYYTTLDGVMQKYIPGDYEFDVPEKLIELHREKDYGKYANSKNEMPICFLGTNHTTGGNSGSPVIDGKGNLIGLNFDRVWEGTMSDYHYDRSLCRNIMVDMRYILFIIDKFADADHLIEEMDLVHPKTKNSEGSNDKN